METSPAMASSLQPDAILSPGREVHVSLSGGAFQCSTMTSCYQVLSHRRGESKHDSGPMTIERGERIHNDNGAGGGARGEADVYELDRTEMHTGGIWCLTRRACCRRRSPGPVPDSPQREMGAQGKLTGPVDPQGKRDAVSNAADCQMSRSGVTGTRLLESASRPRCPLPTADEARRCAESARHELAKGGDSHKLRHVVLCCAVLRALLFRVVTPFGTCLSKPLMASSTL